MIFNISSAKVPALQKQKDALKARMDQHRARKKTQQRKDDTRRKILVGAVVLAHSQNNTAFAQTLRQLLDENLTRPKDRALFDLAEIHTPKDKAA